MKNIKTALFIFFLISLGKVSFAQSCFSISEVMDIQHRLITNSEMFTQNKNQYGYKNNTPESFLKNFKNKQEIYLISNSTDLYGEQNLPNGEYITFLNKFPNSVCVDKLYFSVPNNYSEACDDYSEAPLEVIFQKKIDSIEYKIDSNFNTNSCVTKQLKRNKGKNKNSYVAFHFQDEKAGLSQHEENSYIQSPFAFSEGTLEPYVATIQEILSKNKHFVQGHFKYADFWNSNALVWLTEDQKKNHTSIHAYILSWKEGENELISSQVINVLPIYTDTLSCPQADTHFIYNGLRITSFNDREVWLKTRSKCPSDQLWQTKIVMYDGKQLHIMQGTSKIQVNSLLSTKGNNDFQFDDAFINTSQTIRDFAKKLWMMED